MKTWAKVAVSLGLLALLFLLLPWSDVRTAAARLPLAVWLAVLAGFVAGHGLGVVKWRIMVNAGRAHLGGADAARRRASATGSSSPRSLRAHLQLPR